MATSATVISMVLIARVCLGLILLSSAIGKVRHRSTFTQGVREYQVLPERLVRYVAVIIPWFELLLASMLLAGFMLKLAGLLTAGLLIVVSSAVVINLRRGRAIKCNCHGIVGSKTINWGIVARNGLLVVFAILVSIFAPNATPVQWNAELALLTSPVSIVFAALLLGCCFMLLQLIEWSVFVHERVQRLRKRVAA